MTTKFKVFLIACIGVLLATMVSLKISMDNQDKIEQLKFLFQLSQSEIEVNISPTEINENIIDSFFEKQILINQRQDQVNEMQEDINATIVEEILKDNN